MKNLVVPPLVTALLLAAGVGAGQQPPVLTPRDSAFHALNRLAYGPRPGEVARVAREGVMRWIDRQLAPDQIAAGDRVAREREFRVLHYDRGDLAQLYLDAQRERRERKADTTADQTPGPVEQQGRRLAGQLAELAVVRATISERQLYEVMVDFWTNHFNVFLGKGADRFLLPDYVEHVIRPHALGRFEDLLIATAESPAMLFYLDNWESVALGLNENYARELLELHTLGVDGGYTQQDVSNQLCERFVSDDPPDGCVDDAVAAWKRSGGDLREVLRAIFTSPDFWAPRTLGGKVKTPLEFVVSAARVVGADPDTNPRLAQLVARLGEPLYLHVAPDGYPEKQDAWVNSGALLDRMNAAVALAAGNVPGLVVNLDSIVSPTADADRLVAALDERILGGTLSPNTRKVLREQLADVGDPLQARALAVGLAIGGPEFQRQ